MNDSPAVKNWNLAQRLKFARIGAGLDQGELASRVGTARSSVSNYERGLAEPSASIFVRWANETGVTLDWLAEGIETQKAPALVGEGRLYTPRDSNPEPADYGSVTIPDFAAELIASWHNIEHQLIS